PLPAIAHAIGHRGFAVGRHGHRKAHHARVLALVVVARLDDLVSAPPEQRLADDALDRLILVIAHLDLDRLVDALRASIDRELGLPALADDVESRAELDGHGLVLRRVIDDVLADELERIVALVELRDPDSAGGQRNPETDALAILDLEIHVDLRAPRQAELALHVRGGENADRRETLIDED